MKVKKVIIGILMGIVFVGTVGCNKTINDNNMSQIENEQVDDNTELENHREVSTSEIALTVEKVKNASVTDISDFKYENVENGISITGYSGFDEIVVIPEQIEGINVVEIGEFAFANCETLKGVKIADTVNRLSYSCFSSCYDLEIVICGASLKCIEEFSFNHCEALHTVYLNEQLETLKESCFAGTDELKEIYIPSNVVTLEYPFNETNTNVTIITVEGSTAEQYANEMGIPCEIR